MAKVDFELNREGVRSLLIGERMQTELGKIIERAHQNCGKDYDTRYKTDVYVGRNRVNAQLTTANYAGMASNAKNNTILKAIEASKI